MSHTTYSYDYWCFKKALNNEQCESLLNIKKQHGLESATIDKCDLNEKIRKTEVVFTSEQWVYDLVMPYMRHANATANWNFDIDWCEPAQFTEYKNGGHYTWHQDSMPIDVQENFGPKGKIRKLSTTIVLSDDDEYEGADFELINTQSLTPNPEKKLEILKESVFREKGTIIFFPSSVFHRVTPITSGVRNSLVFWWLGPPFK